MISDFKQPAKDWLADAVNNLGNFLKDGEDPSFTITIDGVVIEIRLNKIPGEGEFDRLTRQEEVEKI